uniref:Uncharacterized protein n=1 Tax=Anguilla anguilla TaxID=7936 RepID=A0A0E9V835_ANGAN
MTPRRTALWIWWCSCSREPDHLRQETVLRQHYSQSVYGHW